MKNVPTFWKRKFLGVCWVMMSNFRLLLEFCWVSSGDKNKVQNCLLWGELWLNYRCLWVVVIELCLVMGSCGWWLWKNGWLWVVMGGGMKLWLVMRGGGGGGVVAKLWLVVGDCGWWWQNYGWLWVVMDVCGWSQDLRTPVTKTQFFLMQCIWLWNLNSSKKAVLLLFIGFVKIR